MTTWPSSEDDLIDAARRLYHQSEPPASPPYVNGADTTTRLPWVDWVECKKRDIYTCQGKDSFRGTIWTVDAHDIKLDEEQSTWRLRVEEDNTSFRPGPSKRSWPPKENNRGPFGPQYDEIVPGNTAFQRVKCYVIPRNTERDEGVNLFCRVGHKKFDEDLEMHLKPGYWDSVARKITGLSKSWRVNSELR